MAGRLLYVLHFLLVLAVLGSCKTPDHTSQSILKEMTSPAGGNSSAPNLHVAQGGNLYLTWLEKNADTTVSLFFSTLENGEWSEEKLIGKGRNWLINYADFPTISSFANGSLAANTLQFIEGVGFAYDIDIHISNNVGADWNASVRPHSDSTPTEHGFVSLLAHQQNKLFAVWLDGRGFFEDSAQQIIATNEMTLRSAVIDENGQLSEQMILDNRVCSCCQTDIAATSNGAMVVYRDRTENEIRDTYGVRNVNGTWLPPERISHDNWEIAGCPVNGPAIDANGNLVVVSWFTVENDSAKTKVAFSSDNGETFGNAITISQHSTLGRVDVLQLQDGSALASWLETSGEENGFKIRRILQDGTLQEPIIITKGADVAAKSFPKMVEKDGVLYFAWTTVNGKKKGVRTASMKLAIR